MLCVALLAWQSSADWTEGHSHTADWEGSGTWAQRRLQEGSTDGAVACSTLEDCKETGDRTLVCWKGQCKPYGIKIMQPCSSDDPCDGEGRLVCNDNKRCQIPCSEPTCSGHGERNSRGLCICEDFYEGNECDKAIPVKVTLVEGGLQTWQFFGMLIF